MCTVTFIPVGHQLFITHNRDEKAVRPKAIPPQQYLLNEQVLLFPKDTAANGTWIAANNHGNAAVLLNGAFVKYIPRPPYRKSRGLIFLDIVASPDLYATWETIDLWQIEPFTIILWNEKKLYACRWDGVLKHTEPLNASSTHCWSSVTLYNTAAMHKRQRWFEDWKKATPQFNLENILQFHSQTGDEQQHDNLLINRNGVMLTVSITSLHLNPHKAVMYYQDMQDHNACYQQELLFTKASVLK
jgi:hypothetical protein